MPNAPKGITSFLGFRLVQIGNLFISPIPALIAAYCTHRCCFNLSTKNQNANKDAEEKIMYIFKYMNI